LDLAAALVVKLAVLWAVESGSADHSGRKQVLQIAEETDREGFKRTERDVDHMARSGVYLGFQIRNRPAEMAARVWIFAARLNAQPISRRAIRSDMQNWNIAVTAFSKTPLLDTIQTPDDLRKLKIEQVRQVADELRQETSTPCP
jgi:hypothetical protein